MNHYQLLEILILIGIAAALIVIEFVTVWGFYAFTNRRYMKRQSRAAWESVLLRMKQTDREILSGMKSPEREKMERSLKQSYARLEP